jgi:hypothetical protein
VQDGNFNGIEGLNPTLNWEGSASSGDVNIDYGIEADARPTTNIASLPRRVWGKASTNAGGWGVSARAERDMKEGDDTALEFDANNDDADINIHVVASAGSGVERVEATKGLNMNGARVTLNPRYNVGTEEADVVVGWDNGDTNVKLTASAGSQEVNVKHRIDNTNIELNASQDSQSVIVDHQMDNTNVKLTASADAQEVTVSQQLDANNRISPTVNNKGDVSVEWQRTLGDDSSLTATLKPNESLNIEWKDNDWTANVDMGLDGTDITGANVHVKRDVSF